MRFRLFALFLCLGLATPALAQKLTNADVVKMVEGRVPPPIIVHMIQTTAAEFNLGPDALVELKKRGVPVSVLEAMMKKTLDSTPSSAPATATPTATTTGEWATRERGVYLERMGPNGKELVQLIEASQSGVDTGGLGGAFSMGLKKTKVKLKVIGTSALTRASADQVTLYVAKMDPRALVLLKAKVIQKDGGREFNSAEIGGFASVSYKAVKGDFEFTTEEVSPGVYRMVLAKPLPPGEYGVGVVGPGGVNPILEFGIDR